MYSNKVTLIGFLGNDAEVLRHLFNAVTTDASKIDALLSIFSLNFRTDPPQTDHGGEGYFPPMALLRGDGLQNEPRHRL